MNEVEMRGIEGALILDGVSESERKSGCPGCFCVHVLERDTARAIFGMLCKRHVLGVFGRSQETEEDVARAAREVPRHLDVRRWIDDRARSVLAGCFLDVERAAGGIFRLHPELALRRFPWAGGR